jgi:hypothetical protein
MFRVPDVEPGTARKMRPIRQQDAELLRRYKALMLKHGLKESLWCDQCEHEGREPGLRASVMDERIDFECRCTVRRYRGQTF